MLQSTDLKWYRALGVQKRVLSLVHVPALACMVTKHFIAPIQGSAAAAVPLEGQVPLVLDIIPDGRI